MKTFERIIGVEGIENLGIVEPGKIYRSAQPDWENPLFDKNLLGIKTVLNLREHSEKEEVEKASIFSVEFPLNVFTNIKISDFDHMVGLINATIHQPILVHCRQGHDRTGVICACYRMAIDGWSYEEAEEEMKSYGYNELWFILTRSLKQYAKAKGFLK